MAISTKTTETIIKDADGHIRSVETTVDSKNIHKSEEGDYIKIYAEGINNLPDDLSLAAFRLLIQLANYASYADIKDTEGGMLIELTPTVCEEIKAKLKIKKSAFHKNLSNLVECKLIRQIRKSCYQLNPNLLGKGYYEYKPTYKQGGIKDIRQTWDEGFIEKTITVDDNSYVISEVWQEIKELRSQLYKEKNPVEREYLQHRINSFLTEVKKISEQEYTKCVKYAVVDNLEQQEETPEQEETPGQEEYYTIGGSSSGYIPSNESMPQIDDDPFNMDSEPAEPNFEELFS